MADPAETGQYDSAREMLVQFEGEQAEYYLGKFLARDPLRQLEDELWQDESGTFAAVGIARFREAIEAAMGRKLLPEYFERLKQEQHTVYVPHGTLDGVLVLIGPNERGANYMHNLAVIPEARGKGRATQLFNRAKKDSPNGLYWRSRPDNPLNQWYFRQADGEKRHPNWHFYHLGMNQNKELIDACRDDALNRPDSFEPRRTNTAVVDD